MNDIKLLTNTQEIKLLRKLADFYIPSNAGAARIVFELAKEDLINCGIEIDPQYNYVAKVAIGIAGINQNNIETNCYSNWKNYNSTKNYGLARIFYIGHYVEIMEYVKSIDGIRDCCAVDYDTFVEELNESEINLEESDRHDAFDLINSLELLNGETDDNNQIGFDRFGKIVAYDYGYQAYSEDQLCSDLSNVMNFKDDTEYTSRYLTAIADILVNEQCALSELKTAIELTEHNLVAELEANEEND